MPMRLSGQASAADMVLPLLREELILHSGPRTLDGAPTWTIEDPSTHRFFRLGWPQKECLARWTLGTAGAVAESVNQETTLSTSPEEVLELSKFLEDNCLLRSQGKSATERMLRQSVARKTGFAKWLLKNYLFLNMPILRPDRLLSAVIPYTTWVYTRRFYALTMALGLMGMILASRQWESFKATLVDNLSVETAIWVALAIALSKLCHEFGHALTARHFGCSVPTMGVALMVLWPVLYSDTSHAWTLPRRRERLYVDAAGVWAEINLATVAIFAWTLLPDSPLRAATFILASATWITTLAVNLNPFMRFDGYFLLSDLLDVENLQPRSFALARWWLRETLFGLGLEPPERFPPRRARLLIAYAIGVWLYRLIVFTGIAIMVYHFSVKLVGILLFAVEIGWFILRPIASEMLLLFKGRSIMRLNVHTRVSLAVAVILSLLAIVPWRSSVRVPAVIQAGNQKPLFSPSAGQIVSLNVEKGDIVAVGDLIALIASPDLDHDIIKAERRVANLDWEREALAVDAELAARRSLSVAEHDAALAELASLRSEKEKLSIRAPIDGIVVSVTQDIRGGDWIDKSQKLALVMSGQEGEIEAFVHESQLDGLHLGHEAVFAADDALGSPIPCHVEYIDSQATKVLGQKILASTYGGPIQVRQQSNGDLVPQTALYRVVFRPDKPAFVDHVALGNMWSNAPQSGITIIDHIARGNLVIATEPRSIAGRLWTRVVALLVRESGF